MKQVQHKTVEPEPKARSRPAGLRRVMRKPEVVRAVGYSSVQIDFLIADKKFPDPSSCRGAAKPSAGGRRNYFLPARARQGS